MTAKNIIVTGLVQGVFFRAQAKEKAEKLGITGWVQNRSDGSVEVHAEGCADALQRLEEWCGHGPALARVDRVDVREASGEGCTEFSVL